MFGADLVRVVFLTYAEYAYLYIHVTKKFWEYEELKATIILVCLEFRYPKRYVCVWYAVNDENSNVNDNDVRELFVYICVWVYYVIW